MTYMDSFRYGIISCERAEANLSQMREHLALHPDIDAVFSVEYEGALLARETARTMGLRVPEDIAIVCLIVRRIAISQLLLPTSSSANMRLDKRLSISFMLRFREMGRKIQKSIFPRTLFEVNPPNS